MQNSQFYIQYSRFLRYFLSAINPLPYNPHMLFDDPKTTGGDKDDAPTNNEEAAAVGPEGGFYDNPDVPGESEGVSNAQQ